MVSVTVVPVVVSAARALAAVRAGLEQVPAGSVPAPGWAVPDRGRRRN